MLNIIEYTAANSHLASGFVPFISTNNFTHFKEEKTLLTALLNSKWREAVYYQLPTGFWTALIKPEQEDKA